LLANDPNAALTDEERSELQRSTAAAEANLNSYTDLASQGSTRTATMGSLGVAAGVLVADDATGVGALDDPLLILLGIGAAATLLFTRAPASDAALANSWRRVAESLQQTAQVGVGLITLKINGERIRGNSERLAEHLARLLRLGSVGGVPSGEPPDPGNDNDEHWWKEILAFLKNIASGIGNASRKQVIRELTKRFTEEEILEIERRLAEAAQRLGKDVPPFIPPP
jgi:hypothetical protein